MTKCFFFGLALAVFLACSPPQDPDRDYNLRFYNLVTNRISSSLVAPATARFCSYPDCSFSTNTNGMLQVTGFLDTQNQFGALVRLDFISLGYPAMQQIVRMRVTDRLGHVQTEIGYWK